MQVKYYPKVDSNWTQIPGQDVGLAVAYPDNYDSNKKYPFIMTVHGIGERSAGQLATLENLILGFDYNNDGVREGTPFLTPDMKKAIDQYGIIVAVPTYSNFFEPALVNWTFDFVKSKYNVVDEMMMIGFSYGGGATLKYITSNITNANRVAVAVPCAPTDHTVTDSVVTTSNLPVHIFVNERDDNGSTNLSVTKSVVNQLNASNPTIRVQYTAFDRNGHGGYNEAITILPPIAPNGEGVLNISENIYQWYLDVLKSGPRQIKSGTTTNPPVEPPVDPPPASITANAGADQTVVEPQAYLDGTKSTGYKSAKWLMVQKPDGVSIWHPVVQSGGWITTRLSFPKEGVYAFKLITYSEPDYKGTVAEDTVVVTYNTTAFPPPKVVLQKVYIPKNDNFVYVYDDGSVETKAS